jgi:hypothetical protein
MKSYFEDKTVVKYAAWDCEIDVVLTSNVDASVKRRDPNHEPGTAYAICMHSAGNPKCLIVLPYGPSPRTIAHECWHAIRWMLDFCGATYENETVAYHLGHLVGEVSEFARKNNKPRTIRKRPDK